MRCSAEVLPAAKASALIKRMRFVVPLVVSLVSLSAMRAQAPKGQEPDLSDVQFTSGEPIKMPQDGTPWPHPDTDLRFPAKLASFEYKFGFKDKRPEVGVLLTYVDLKLNLKADLILAPCPKNIATSADILPPVTEYMRSTARDLRAAAASAGYKEVEEKRQDIKQGKIEIWKLGAIPTVQMSMEYVAADPESPNAPPPIIQLLNVILYQDTWVQTSMIVPASIGEDGRKAQDEFITQLVQTVREPAIRKEMLKLCHDYAAEPLKKESQDNADSLLTYSRESPVFEIPLPGEALTPVLNELATVAEGTEKDVLRGYLVGSGAKALMGDPLEAQLEEGARIASVVYGLVKAKNAAAVSPTMEELNKAVAEKKGAEWLRKRMNAPVTQ